MATAPRPGAARSQEHQADSWHITLQGRILELPLALTMQERFTVRTATGFPLESFLPSADDSRVGEDSVAVLWWLARRHNGEPRLSWAQACHEWPVGLQPDELDVELVTDDGEPTDDPGKSEPA